MVGAVRGEVAGRERRERAGVSMASTPSVASTLGAAQRAMRTATTRRFRIASIFGARGEGVHHRDTPRHVQSDRG